MEQITVTKGKKSKGKKGRKMGRNLVWCANYRNQQTREKNKARKIAKHLKIHPGDTDALKVLKTLPKVKGVTVPSRG